MVKTHDRDARPSYVVMCFERSLFNDQLRKGNFITDDHLISCELIGSFKSGHCLLVWASTHDAQIRSTSYVRTLVN